MSSVNPDVYICFRFCSGHDMGHTVRPTLENRARHRSARAFSEFSFVLGMTWRSIWPLWLAPKESAALETIAQAFPSATRALEMAARACSNATRALDMAVRACPDAASAAEVNFRACHGAALEAAARNKIPSSRPKTFPKEISLIR